MKKTLKEEKERKKRICKLADKCAAGASLNAAEKQLFKEIFGWMPA